MHVVGADVDDDVPLIGPFHCFLNLLQKNLWDSSTKSVHSFQKLQLERVIHGLKEIVLKGKVPNGFIERSEGWLLVVMVHAPVPVKDRHALPLSLLAVAPIHAVIGTVVPLAGEHIETLWVEVKNNI